MQLTPEQVRSVNILLSAVQVAQRRGAYSLQDAATLQEAVDSLVPREEQERQRQEAEAAAASQEEAEAVVGLDESASEEAVESSDDSDVGTEDGGEEAQGDDFASDWYIIL